MPWEGRPANIRDIPWYDYSNRITHAIISDSVTNISFGAFYGCGYLVNITIPDSVTRIGQQVFAFSGLTNITIPDSVTSISNSTFAYCFNLTSVTIPVSVTSIGNSAFQACDSLTDVYYSGTESQRAAMTIGPNNALLLNATWHYNSTGST